MSPSSSCPNRSEDDMRPILDAEVVLKPGLVVLQLRAVELVDEPSVLHHKMPVGNAGGKAEVLLDEQYRQAVLPDTPDGLANLPYDDRSKALGGLVEQEQLRAGA